MKKAITWMLFVTMVLTTALSGTPALAQATTTTTHITRTRTEVRANPCTGEPVLFEVELKLIIHRTTNPDGSTHVHLTSNLHGSGEGLETGAKYRLTAVAQQSTNVVGATTQTLHQNGIVTAQGNVPNFLFQEIEHITINANGDVTTNFVGVFTKCQE